jgi:6-phosphogluconolactonase (cycloisomerase 2 family)
LRQLSPSARKTTIGLIAAAMLASVILASGLLNAKAHAGGAPGALTPNGCTDDTTAGPDNCADDTPGLRTAASSAVSRDGKSVYVVSEDSTLVRFKRNTASGALTPKGCFEDNGAGLGACTVTGGLGAAGSVVISTDGKSVYVASEDDGAVAIFKRNTQSGALTPKGCVQDAGIVGGDCAQSTPGLIGATWAVVTPDGKSVYASSGNGAVVRFKRDKHSGALTPKGCIQATGASFGCAQTAEGLNGAGALAVSADNRSVYVTSESGAIVTFKRETSSGRLEPKGCIEDSTHVTLVCSDTTSGLDSAEALAVSDDGKSVYVTSGFANAIVRFHRNTHSGLLTAKGCVDDNDTTPVCSKHANGMEEGAAVAVSHDGKSVYYGSGTDDAIVRFQRDRNSGALTSKGCIDDNDTSTDPTQGEDNCAASTNGLAKVTSVAISRDGKSVYTTSETDGAIVRFQRKTG